MSSTSRDAVKSVNIYGHISALPKSIAAAFGGTVSTIADPECDVAIFAINPAAGIDGPTIELWKSFDEFQTPRLVVIIVMEGMEMDFDDAVMVANRVFDTTVTQYLVLHDESGAPIGVISLKDLTTIDYSVTPPVIGHADEELQEVVAEFREEYLSQMEEMEDGAFAAGILFPALPINLAIGLGVDLVQKYLDELPSRS